MAFANRQDLKAMYGDFHSRSGNIAFDIADVPQTFRDLAAYAEFWGVGDDWRREQLVAEADPRIRRDLATAVLGRHDEILASWLGGPQAKGPIYSSAYVAYTGLLMAAEAAHFTERRTGWDWKPTPYAPPSSASDHSK